MAPPPYKLGTGAACPPTSMMSVYHEPSNMTISYRIGRRYVVYERYILKEIWVIKIRKSPRHVDMPRALNIDELKTK